MNAVKEIVFEQQDNGQEVVVYRDGRTYHAEIWSDQRGGVIKIGHECASQREALIDVGWIGE